ncbi:hypothetical protein JZ751_011526 [Albula glossodonta]|uniref:PHD-type domain-containing protein n=1 Tax=Albula glossodonta TaxID=121402 RepID=A0A8T2N6L4_9TELE|nr:hypothetical protein JZ751_011526 [Albula glossodonta]
MELQTLQEALKVEIQVHQKLVAQMKQDPQNAELKKQLHELQAKITALSEKQKKVVEQLRKDLLLKPEQPELKAWTVTVTSVLSTKAVPLVLKAANPTMPVSIVAQRPTVNMVTTIGNMAQSNVINTDSQNAPINLQTSAKVTNQGLSKNAVMVQATSTAQPIRVPQFTPPPRLMPRPSCLPQVRPRSITPNVPIAPAPPAMMPPPQLLQRPLMLTAKMTGASLPSTSSPIHQVRIINGQPCATLAKTLPSCQLTGIVITTPADPSHLTSPQTLQIASLVTDTKTVKNQGGTNQKAVNTSSSPTPPSVPKPNHEHDPQKRAFMVSLGLVTHHHLEAEIQSRRQERKRRTTANPVYSGATFEPERKKSVVTYLNTPVSQTTRKRGRPPKYSSIGDIHEDFCTVCRRSGQLLMCDTCSRVYHLDCLDPPLITIPKGMWICPKCQDQVKHHAELLLHSFSQDKCNKTPASP